MEDNKDWKIITEYVECSCNMELIRLVYDYEEDCEQLYISLYKYGTQNKTSWKTRLRHIWRIIKDGVPWEDCITLEKYEINKLRKFINTISEMNK
jgi:hypothetical protein